MTDFLIGYVADSFPERKSIVSSLLYIEQLKRFNPEKSLIPLEKELQTIIRDKIAKSKIRIQEEGSKSFTKNKGHAIILEVLCKYCQDVTVDTLLLEHFKQISFAEGWGNILQKIEYFFLNIGDAPQTFNYIKEHFIKIIEKMMNSISDSDNAKQIPLLFAKYEHNYDDYTESNDGFNNLCGVIESVLQTNEQQLKRDREDSIKAIDEAIDLYDDISYLERELKNDLFPNVSFDYDFGIEMDENYWEKKIKENLEALERQELRNDGYDEHYIDDSRTNEESSIDDLFEKQE